MTKAEAIKEIENWSCVDSGIPHIDSIDAIKIIYKIYDELENASCKTCKWLNEEVCTNGDSPMCADYPNTDMLCGHYEKR